MWWVEGRGYACRIRPNSAINGIYLPEKHDRVHNFQHFAWIYDTFNRYRALGNNGNCNYGNARNAMACIKRTMATGTFPGTKAVDERCCSQRRGGAHAGSARGWLW